jgi:hypothetical protein
VVLALPADEAAAVTLLAAARGAQPRTRP